MDHPQESAPEAVLEHSGLPQGGKGMEDCLDHGGPGGNRCMGKPEATGIIDLALAAGGEHENVSPFGDFS